MKRRKFDADVRPSTTARFEHGQLVGYMTVSFYDNDQPGEIFIKIGKTGSFVQGSIDIIARQFSYMLQMGVPGQWIVSRLKGLNLEPLDEQGKSIYDTLSKAFESVCSDRGSDLAKTCQGEEVPDGSL